MLQLMTMQQQISEQHITFLDRLLNCVQFSQPPVLPIPYPYWPHPPPSQYYTDGKVPNFNRGSYAREPPVTMAYQPHQSSSPYYRDGNRHDLIGGAQADEPPGNSAP